VTAIDTTVALTAGQLAALRGAGVSAVSRYIAPQVWKVCTPAEYARYGPAGMQITLNWESGAQDLKTLGAQSTRTAAFEAVRQAKACGYPAGAAIYVSADWNVTAGEWPVVAANLRIIRPIYAAAGYRLGMYAPWDALSWAKRDGLVDFYWQAGMSTSWSAGRNANPWPGAHLRQRHSTTLAGVACDTSDILIPAFGQAGAAPSPGGTMATSDNTNAAIDAWRHGSATGADGVTVEPVKWEIRHEAFEAATSATLSMLGQKLDALTAAVAALSVPGVTDAQIDALAKKLAGALPVPPAAPSAAEIAKAVNDDAAARLTS
jgi:hypothetical protein